MKVPAKMAPRNAWLHPVLSAVGLLAVYFGVPNLSNEPYLVGLGLVIVGGGLLLIAWTMIRELERLRGGEDGRGTVALLMLLMLLVVGFSAIFFLVQRANPGEFAGLETRTDALYFTVSTLATVGYGDVHAVGQVARLLVIVAITFHVVVVGALFRNHIATRP